MVRILSRASVAHLCGFLQFILARSRTQSPHRHHWFCSCGRGCLWFLSQADT
jgi:hypothetical protein